MANPVSAPHFRVTLAAGNSQSDGCWYTATYTRLGGSFWGGSNMLSIRDHSNTHKYYWAAPGKGNQWQWSSANSYYYIYYNNADQVLSSNFYASGNAGGAEVNGYRWATSFTETWFAAIDRGNARQGARYITAGAFSNSGGSWYGDWKADITLYTTKIADVSNINPSASVDSKNTNPSSRYIRASLSFTNPEAYYTGYIDGVARTSFQRLVTKDDFNKNIGIPWYIKGKDGTTYASGVVYTGIVEPGGIGAWYKESNTVVSRGVAEVYYKNWAGNIIKVNEIWARRSGQSLRTVK